MIPRECKRLAEVDFPIAVVSEYAPREKGLPQDHPSRMHLWWARRPLASCRAMLLALLLPDPGDPHCPEDFKARARTLLRPIPGQLGNSDEELRHGLLRFIGDFANWHHGTSATFIEVGRGLVKAAYPEKTPLVVDPFAGGGSIPLEALRLGCDTFASDLNPVACFILKTMLEDIPRYGPGLADELRRAGAEIKAATEKELAAFYPPDPDGAKPIAYLWARTVRCEAPNCGAEIPLIRSLWLCKKASRKRALRYHVVRKANDPPWPEFEIFEPQTDKDVSRGTVTRAKATCIACGAVLPAERVRAQLVAQRGGADVGCQPTGRRMRGARMLTVVTLRRGETGRHYRLPSERDYCAVEAAQARLANILEEWRLDGCQGLCPVPNEPTPLGGGSGAGRAFSLQKYGMLEWGDLFTARQKLALLTIAHQVRRSGCDGLALALGKVADLATSGCLWHTKNECPNQVLTTGRIRPFWDFAEGVPTSESSGGLQVSVEKLIGAVLAAHVGRTTGDVVVAPAQQSPLASEAAEIWFTDPPYDDQIPYADLSDLFFVWLKRALPDNPIFRDPFDRKNPLTPKAAEAVRDESRFVEGHPKDRAFYESAMAQAFAQGRRVMREDGIGSVIFAHKTTEGWEALLTGMIRSGWVITGSWPIATEMTTRLRARDSAALATSVHLVCRPRADDSIGDWADVLRELPDRVGEWMARLEQEAVRGADLVFACIGPALEIFSKFSRVETPDGREVPLAEYLEKVWEVVGRVALNQILGTAEAQARNGGAGALEEDARLTALFLWTLRSTASDSAEGEAAGDAEEEADNGDAEEDAGGRKPAKGFTLIYDIVRRFAQPLGIHLETWKDRIIETDKGIVRLLPVTERAHQLFGDDGAAGLADRIERTPVSARQLELFPAAHEPAEPQPRGRRRRFATASAQSAVAQVTTLDRVHAAMLLQGSGRTNGLRALLAAEQERGPDFLRLGNALTALYPQGSEEKRLLDAMLLAVPR